MANYTPTFSKPYPSGWVDKPSKTTPVTAAIMDSYDTAIAALEAYLRDNAIDTVTVSVEQFPSDGREWLGTITVGSNQYRIYMPSLRYENSVSDGIKIGTITLGEQSFDVYAPASSAGGSTVSVVPKTLTGTNIAEITVDGTTYQLYAPTGGGSGSTVTAEATLTEGTQIGKITIDGVETILYAPNGDGSVTVDSALSTESENPVQNKVVTAELNKKIETLDDESQAPDAVNFDLDSELSLTSVKGVQNKVIAEEFQKYANGTKVVAKATEAETAKTAASATTAQSAKTAESATKATQDAQGNIIDTTYAKKTEIPQGAVVDDALSSTSENAIQNKVVKAEFDKVYSNFTDLEMLGWSVPKECPIQNEVNENQFVQKVGRVDLGSLDWVSVDTNTSLYTTSIKDIKTLSNNVFLLGYSVVSYDIETSKMTNKNIKMSCLDKQDFYIKNDSYTNSAAFKTAMQGQYLYYELATPITKTIDGNEKTEQIDASLTSLGKCKNLLKPTLQTTTQNDITCTANGDGTYTLNGTASGTSHFPVAHITDFAKNTTNKDYKLAGCPTGGINKYDLRYEINNAAANGGGKDFGEGVIVKNDKVTSTNITFASILIAVMKGVTINNLVFKPMLTTNLSATYDDFVSYTGDGDTLTADVANINSDLSNVKDGTTPAAKAVADEDGNNIKSTYATKAEIPSAPSSLYETVKVGITTDLFAKSVTQHYVNCERVGNICTLSFWLQATATVDYKNRHELFYIDKIPKNNLTIGFCVVNFNHSVSNTANSAYNYINSISVEEYYDAILKRNTSKVYLLPYRTGSNILSSGYEIIGQISWAVEV